ncbi:hypothetical protein [Polyangium fumosum]|uniref:Dickkopf N-terminal cysteine-rich domain-containing protein n=1 Tax=Polyangium fumosum TaxID=889272 RepID=A0A4U1IXD1_9BACT|nr:hypothetical protein [Polyangium fumosum]TKC98708.1 hypothetical protein E8A74_40095 [Polyangium fumosum]
MKPSFTRWFIVSVGIIVAGAACVPEPKSVPCSNQGDCEGKNVAFQYCLERRCVECVSDASCGMGNTCVAGLCKRSCKDGRDCLDGYACANDRCTPL